MNQSLLICIAFHYVPERIKYLTKILDAFLNEYKCPVHIIIDTNKYPADIGEGDYSDNITICSHLNLAHPFHLTWKHRQHIKDNIDKYDNFMYIEDDMYLPFENYLNYLENFKKLWPERVPGFVRIEKANDQEFISDVPEKQPYNPLIINDRAFCSFKFPFNYHAFWVMPQKELKETMKDNFVRLSDGREFAAMYTGWELGKPAMLELDLNGKISDKCYSYHLPNNYALGDGPNGKIKPEEIFL